jgi:hypothetical protein
VIFFAGLFLGVALAVVALGFLAIGAYGRGYEEAEMRRNQWRTELLARHLDHRPRALGAHL